MDGGGGTLVSQLKIVPPAAATLNNGAVTHRYDVHTVTVTHRYRYATVTFHRYAPLRRYPPLLR